MKRWLSILAVFGCIVALSGCKNENEKRQAYFNAKVLEINKEYVDVRCIEAFNSGISVDEEFSVTKDVVSAEGVPELNVDDNIRVVFNGDVMESDPLQIGTVYAIYLLDENGEVIPNNYQLLIYGGIYYESNHFNHSYGNCSVGRFFLWCWNERSNGWSNTTFNDYRFCLHY